VQPLECCSEFSRVGGSHRGPASEISSARRAYFKARLEWLEFRISSMTIQCSRPQGGVVGSDGWVGEVHPLECHRGYYEVVDLTEGSARLGFCEARRDSARRGEGEGARGVGASGSWGVGGVGASGASGRRGSQGVGGVRESGRGCGV
jgi:hypothetical protein